MRSNNKRLAFFLGSLKFGGAERVTSRLANELANANYEIHIIIYLNQIDYQLDDRITVHKISLGYKNGLIKIISVYFKLAALLFKLRPRVVISPSRISSILLAWTFYPRLITRFDSYPFFFRSKRKRVWTIISHNLPNVKYVICPSQELLDDVRPYFIRRSKLVQLYNPVDLDLSSDLSHVSEKYFVTVGRLHFQKHVDVILHAFSRSFLRNTYRFVILGDGPEMGKLKDLAQELGINDRVDFLGFVNSPFQTIAGARFLVSASSKEGFPNVLVEALSLGVPVIAANCKTGPKEIVIESINGFLFKVGDTEDLVKTLNKMDDNNLNIKLKTNARGTTDRFRMNVIVKKWKDLLTSF